ncbi:precorrin-6y C5,15-methyltransferase (decarboxylating) subunit CbiE [Faecalibacterium prausnitzii]|uniref:precorrin-6y C5,15-methyltransferase (decarboxylating) subunit CbiE n=1 Tax=Faecalibacterium prausnitzii TaxID=853 RepID=UPI00290B58A6|nr:precorrin-6y C5,15-methyltransferase (decarboxylating) subunit CbiE [Faecalibacterium prausnitzii]MDU8666212.1 precorrin-6y C5,15-methyltransferase (decarboxylating) subunit CbiE [Faecalibacterium prausnitzii]
MNVTLIGMGSGQPENLTLQGLAALRQADLILGARRLLAVLPAGCTENRAAAYRPDEVAELLQTSGAENAVLVYSGDTGFYSGASSMMEKLEALGVRARVLPGLSSIQLLAAALGRPWQGWNLVSAHGRTCDPVAECMQGRPTFFLTGGSEDPATLCAQLAAEGFGDVQGVVGQCLGTPEEKIFRGSVKELAAGRFNSLSVLLVEAAEVLPRRAPGLPDEAFERGDVPMTKQEVRAAVLAKLAVRPEDILWDVGAGTGSVSVELALAAPRGRVYAVECRPEGCALIKANREKFRTRNLVLVEGLAPAALSDLPAPDAVFIGGSKGSLAAIVDAALDKNPDARICVSAIALETLSAAVAALTAKGRTVQVSQIAVSRAKAVGGLHLMMAQNPIYLITGE